MENLVAHKEISSNVLFSIYENSMKSFLDKHCSDYEFLLKKYNEDPELLNIPQIFGTYIPRYNLVDTNIMDDFLIEELLYGRHKNCFIRYLKSNYHDTPLSFKEKFVEFCELNRYEIPKSFRKNSDHNFKYKLRDHVEIGNSRIVYFSMESKKSSLTRVVFILCEGKTRYDELKVQHVNLYTSFDIDISSKTCSIRFLNDSKIRNTVPNSTNVYRESVVHLRATHLFSKINTGLSILYDDVDFSKAIVDLLTELSDIVLKESTDFVTDNATSVVTEAMSEISTQLRSFKFNLNKTDRGLIKNHILNNLIKIHFIKENPRLNGQKIKEKFGVQLYPHRIAFRDETIGEAKIKSESAGNGDTLFTAAAYYDLKAQMEHSKKIFWVTFYWLFDTEFGTSLHLKNRKTLHIVFKNLHYTREELDNVLQYIDKYVQS